MIVTFLSDGELLISFLLGLILGFVVTYMVMKTNQTPPPNGQSTPQK